MTGTRDRWPSVAAVILAAGASTRFGSSKHAVRLDGRTMLERVVGKARVAGLDPILVVAPSALELPPGTQLIANDEPATGMSRSLRLGIDAVPPTVEAALILLADQPTLPIATIDALLHSSTVSPVVAARDPAAVVAPPVLVRREAFGLAAEATADAGLRSAIEAHPELVATVDVSQHPPDIDTPADLAALGEPCPGCGALLAPQRDGPTHEYLGASAACWMVFGELEAREFGEPGYGRLHRHSVDVYAVQHPGVDGRRQRQSVAVHLIGLCHWLEHGLAVEQLTPITQRLTSDKRDWPRLEPPAWYDMTVLDVRSAADAAAHERLVRRWAESVWETWSPYHSVIRRWSEESLGG
jgi:CTP:molybdopterin cytidylyltransferase MocA